MGYVRLLWPCACAQAMLLAQPLLLAQRLEYVPDVSSDDVTAHTAMKLLKSVKYVYLSSDDVIVGYYYDTACMRIQCH